MENTGTRLSLVVNLRNSVKPKMNLLIVIDWISSTEFPNTGFADPGITG